MQTIKLEHDFGVKQTFDKWNGKYLTKDSYVEVVNQPLAIEYFNNIKESLQLISLILLIKESSFCSNLIVCMALIL